MCGIFGTYHEHSLDPTQRNVAWQMLRVGAVRGTDGCGVFAVDKTNNVRMIKSVGGPEDLFLHDDYTKFSDYINKEAKLIVGHHRHATKGVVSGENAHPFQVGHITLVHNGTVNSGLTMSFDDVDSRALTEAISKDGVVKTFEKITGAYACVWWDDNEKKLFFLKNNQRPLTIAKSRSNNFFWASERPMLTWLLWRNYSNLDFEKDVTYYDLEENTLYSLDRGTLAKEETVTKKWYGTTTPTVYPITRRGGASSTGTRDDFQCEFKILSEEMKTRHNGVVFWRYVGQSDRQELVFFDYDEPIKDWENELGWFGFLKGGVQRNTNGWIDSEMPHNALFYEVREQTVTEIVDTQSTGKVLPFETKDKYPLSKTKAKRLIKQGCVTCSSHININQIHKCFTYTSQQDNPLGLFCINCTDKLIKENPNLTEKYACSTSTPTVH